MLQYIKDIEWRNFIGNPPILSSIEEKLKNCEHKILPSYDLLFNAFNLTPMNKLKVVLLCEKPYARESESFGCSYIVDKTVKEENYPTQLKNILEELKREYPEFNKSKVEDLTNWCKEGVLLLNMILTCEIGSSLSHEGYGWETFIKDIIIDLDKRYKRILFVCFGYKTKRFVDKIIINNNVLTFKHPNLMKNTFCGNDCFKKCNDKLIEMGILPVRWWSIFEKKSEK